MIFSVKSGHFNLISCLPKLKLKKLIFSFGILFCFGSNSFIHADLLPKSMPCRDEVSDILDNQKIRGPVIPQFSLDPNTIKLRWPIGDFGEWIQISFGREEMIKIHFFRRGDIEIFDLSNACEPNLFFRKSMAQQLESNDFSDFDLEQLVRSGDKILIYLWSPRFSLSLRYAYQVELAARESGHLLVALIAQKDFPIFQELIHNDKYFQMLPEFLRSSRRNKSFELIYRGGEIHLPTLHRIANSRLRSSMLVGVNSPSSLRRWLVRNDE